MIFLETYNSTKTAVNGLQLSKLLVSAFATLVKDDRVKKTMEYRVEVSFVGTKRIKELSTHYYDTPRETDVISLSYFEENFKKSALSKKTKAHTGPDFYSPDSLTGEIFICVPYALKQAKKIGQSLNEELKFLFVHGLLHVFGYDHMKPVDEEHMLKLTYKILGRKK